MTTYDEGASAQETAGMARSQRQEQERMAEPLPDRPIVWVEGLTKR